MELELPVACELSHFSEVCQNASYNFNIHKTSKKTFTWTKVLKFTQWKAKTNTKLKFPSTHDLLKTPSPLTESVNYAVVKDHMANGEMKHNGALVAW